MSSLSVKLLHTQGGQLFGAFSANGRWSICSRPCRRNLSVRVLSGHSVPDLPGAMSGEMPMLSAYTDVRMPLPVFSREPNARTSCRYQATVTGEWTLMTEASLWELWQKGFCVYHLKSSIWGLSIGSFPESLVRLWPISVTFGACTLLTVLKGSKGGGCLSTQCFLPLPV